MAEVDAKRELGELAGVTRDWRRKDDRELVKALKRLLTQVDRTRRLKAGGLTAYSDHAEVVRALRHVIEVCASVGIFLVDRGEVEGWAPDGMFTESEIEAKTGIAESIAALVRDGDPRVEPLVVFVKGVCDFLCAAKSPRPS